MITWILSRHVLYCMVCYSVWAHIPTTIAYGCYQGKQLALTGPFPVPKGFMHLLEPFRDPEGVVCFNHEIKWGFLSVLLMLQCVMLMWFYMILKVAVKVIRGGQAEEVRSDDEECDDAEDEEAVDLHDEQEFHVDASSHQGQLTYAGSRQYGRSRNRASGVSLAGQKELLNRIGCDKGTRDG